MLLDAHTDFFATPGISYLNCAYHGPMPRVAITAVEESLLYKKAPHLLPDALHFSMPNEYRHAVARLIGASPEEIAVTDSASHGIQLLVSGLDWRVGDEVVLPARTFPSNDFPWRSLESRGVVLRRVDDTPREGASATVQLEAWERAMSPRTRVVSVSWVSYVNGQRRDLEALGELARRRGALFVVDGSQGVGGLPFDLGRTPCDLLTCAGYKWLLSPYGTGFAYVAPGLTERLAVTRVGWQSLVGAEDFNNLSRCDLELAPGARRFDKNEAASFFNLAGAIASLRYLAEVGPAAIERHVRALLDHLVARLPPAFRVTSAQGEGQRSNILTLASNDPEATRAGFERLRARGVHASLREGAIRLSPNLYNGPQDIDRVLEGLADA